MAAITITVMGKRSLVPTLTILLVFGGLPTVSVQRAEASHTGDVPPAVWVSTDKSSYHLSEPILVIVRNNLSTVIYAPPEQADCSVISIQRLAAGRWETPGECLTVGSPASFPVVAPTGKMVGVLSPTTPDSGTQGPLVGQPSVPGVFEAFRGRFITRQAASRVSL